MTVVKICGLTNLEDARWAWRCGADLLGFILVPASPRYVAPPQVAGMVRALAEEGCHLPTVAVCATGTLSEAVALAQETGSSLLQWHGATPQESIEEMALPLILAWRVADQVPWHELAARPVWAHLLDSYVPGRLGGTGTPWHWELLRRAEPPPGRIILAGGLTPDNVCQALRQAAPWGVDVSSGVESRPGRKDPARVERFIANVREEDTR